MRIRSIKPEFCRSEDIEQLSWEDRFLFTQLWMYVDDNGVGIDRVHLIAADLFAGDLARDIERGSRETLAKVSGGLQRLSEAGLVTRYEVENRSYIYITNWSKHQRIDKPAKPRYPLPTCENATIRDTLATPSRHSRETPAPGTEEQRNRGTGNKPPNPLEGEAGDTTSAAFQTFWDTYRKKVGRPAAVRAWRRATKRTDPDTIIEAAAAFIERQELRGKHPEYTPHPATWLNREGWNDDLPPLPTPANPPAPALSPADWLAPRADAPPAEPAWVEAEVLQLERQAWA